MSDKLSPKVKSDILLNLKDINEVKKDNLETKSVFKGLQIEDVVNKYNTKAIKALEAPVPNISLHFNEVLVRAVPIEIKSKGGIILSAGTSDYNIASTLDKMSEAVNTEQEILAVGDLITEDEKTRGIRPGRMCKMKLDRFRSISDNHTPGVISTMYNIPSVEIEGNDYIILDKRDIMYTFEKE